ncbi:MAG: amidase [Pseudomonadales bacterium]|jgi:amidase|nr:amidase [Pseudomonadales bacterium]
MLPRTSLLPLCALALLVACADPAPPAPPTAADRAPPGEDVATLDIPELQSAYATGERTVESVVEDLVARIATLDPTYRAVIAVAADADERAAALDAAPAPTGPLHGIPVLLKDNIETERLPTTAGSLALEGYGTGRDAPLVARLRAAGAVILGKANLSEWANFRSERSSSGWSGVGGQTRNAIAPARSPCGSSSGSAVAVALGYAPLAVGTETNGSVVCPASVNGIVGFKPTVGAIPGAGIVPIAHSQDTAGPMARTVADAALGYAVMAGEDVPSVLATVTAGDLAGRRIGIVRSGTGYHEGVDALFEEAVAALDAAGAVLVDDLAFEPYETFGEDTYTVLLHEFRTDLDGWFASLPTAPPVTTLEDVIAFNRAQADSSMPFFRQEILEKAAETGGVDAPEYREALTRVQAETRANGIDRLLAEHDLHALVAPTEGPAWVIDVVNGDHFLGGFSTYAAVAGYPHLTVPMGRLHGLPIGLSFVGGGAKDAAILALGHAFEQLGHVPERGAPLDGLP